MASRIVSSEKRITRVSMGYRFGGGVFIIERSLSKLINEFLNFILWLKNSLKSETNRNNFLNSIKKFLNWALLKYSNEHEQFIHIENIIHANIIKSTNVQDYHQITQDEINNFFQASLPYSNLNPFVERNRIRNYLIFLILFETGIRSGELLNLQINDVFRDDNKFYIKIINRNKYNNDTRTIKPRIKTIYSERIIGISDNTYLLFEEYLKFHRSKNKYRESNYLFLSDRKKPLSIRSLNTIFNKASKTSKTLITPHIVRHHFAETMLSFLIEKKNIDMERAKDELRVICGWSLSSNMPSYYTRKYIQRIANKSNMERINLLYERD